MAAIDPPAIEIAYVGGPTTVLQVGGMTFITDPTFDPAGGEYPSGAVTLKKLSGPAQSVSDIGEIDVALVSHDQHADNLDKAGKALLAEIPVVLTTDAGADRLGNGSIGLQPWETHVLRSPTGATIRITATPARHGPAGIEKLTGSVIGFVISLEGRGDAVYATGDTVWYDGTAEVARRFDPEIVLLFAGAVVTRGPFHLTMDTNDAVEAAVAFRNSTIVPVHHEGWAHFTQSQEDIHKTFSALGLDARLRLVEPGKTLRFGMEAAPSR
jgi:L-ascorbate metabolism protein UlaG (beta-lactamase superfamily)